MVTPTIFDYLSITIISEIQTIQKARLLQSIGYFYILKIEIFLFLQSIDNQKIVRYHIPMNVLSKSKKVTAVLKL